MTLPLNSRLSALYDTNGTQKEFGFGFRVFFDPDNGGYGLEVRRQIAGGYEIIPKSDYLVLPVEDNSSGVVRFNVAPSAGQQIYIAGKTPTIQQLVLTNFGRYSAESIETQFDFITAIIQEWISGLDEETRQRIENDQLLKQHIEQRINDFIAVVDSRFEGKWLEISEYLDTLLPMFFNIMREEIEAFTNEQLPAIINQRLSEVIDAEMDAYLDDLSHQVSQNIEAINEAAANATAAESAKNEAIVARNQIVSEIGETKNYFDEGLSQLSTAASKYYSTLLEANYYITYMGVNELVYVGNYDGAEGLYYKASPEATNLTKSNYDPLTQAKNYSDQKIKTIPIYEKVDGYVETVLDVDGFTRIKMQTKSGQTYFYDSRIDENSQSIADLSATVKGVEIYKNIQGIATVILDVNGFTRIKEQNVTTGQFIFYVGAKQKNLVAGTGISILETAETITIEAGETVYETPNEYVLCLVIGQSNNTTEGGNEAEAPVLPTGVCLIWNNTYNTLGDINDSPQKASVVPAMALEFYKQTGMGLIVVNSAVGASAMSELAASIPGRSWDVTGTLRQPAIDRLNACKSYLDTNDYCYQMGFISWSQGEQDGVQIENNVITISDYTTAFTTFTDFIKTNVGNKVPFIITRTAYRTADNASYKAIRDAQMSFAHTMPTVWMGYTGTTKFFNRNLMNDSVHYNQQGKNIVGNAIAKVATKLSAGVN